MTTFFRFPFSQKSHSPHISNYTDGFGLLKFVCGTANLWETYQVSTSYFNCGLNLNPSPLWIYIFGPFQLTIPADLLVRVLLTKYLWRCVNRMLRIFCLIQLLLNCAGWHFAFVNLNTESSEAAILILTTQFVYGFILLLSPTGSTCLLKKQVEILHPQLLIIREVSAIQIQYLVSMRIKFHVESCSRVY